MNPLDAITSMSDAPPCTVNECWDISVKASQVSSCRVRSQAERYEEMRASLSQRVAPGRSGIHGYGAFALKPHAAGELGRGRRKGKVWV